ncbi:MAG TPA: GGDEF domain-containing protein [Roseiarcus sp.]|nr:GGDEF domain-containing protein [Roseiarcus sp.]
MLSEAIDDLSIFSSTIPAGREQKRTAQTVLLACILIFLAAAPFARLALVPVWAFVPAYETVIATNDLITAVLLFGHFRHAGSRDHYILACGFLLTGFLAIAHELSFPGVFVATGLFGDHGQTTPWLYMFWHASLPLFVIVYAAMKDGAGMTPPQPWRPRYAILVAVAAAAALTALAVALPALLPEIAPASRDATLMTIVVSDVLGLGLFALAILWLRRPYFVLDLWIMVVMCASICEVALSAALNAGRFDLGFYIGCAYGLFASSVMIMALPLENGRLYERLKEAAGELGRLATTDALTGVANRRAFEKVLDVEWRRAARRRLPLSLALIDIDFFKNYNDCYGHPAGDQCLKAVAAALSNNTRRAGEMTARYGGEEFALLLPHADLAEARRLAERVCYAVAALNIPHAQSAAGPCVTVSIGVAAMSTEIADAISARGAFGLASTKLIEAADKALYAAKAMGRNRVCVFAASPDGSAEEIAALPKAAE